MAQKETRAEIFKRALTAATRSMSRQRDVEVAFTADNGGGAGPRINLPPPPRELSPVEASRLRGAGDAAALRLAHHDNGAHNAMRPDGPRARALYDASEEARVQAIGARSTRVDGVRADAFVAWNLVAYLPSVAGFDVTVGVRNLLGQREAVPAPEDYDRTTAIATLPGEGRELYARLGYRY